MGLLQERCAKYTLPQEFMAQGIYPYFREIEGKQGTEVMMDGHRVLMFGSNAYTGLTGDQRVIDAGIAAMQRYGSGCAGSRFLHGTLDIHVQLEKELAEFVGKDETLCFPTGFTVNSGVISQLVDRNDYIICDDRDHASIVDGRRLSFATQLKFKHNDMEDLEKQLQAAANCRFKLIVTDGVFSMDGNAAPLDKICELAEKYDALVMVDECHSAGVLGKTGRGITELYDLRGKVDILTGTLGKAFGGAVGGFTTGRKEIIDMLRQRSRPYLFSNSLPPAVVGASIEMFKMLEESDALHDQLVANVEHFRTKMVAAGFDIKPTQSAICAVMLYDAKLSQDFAAELQQEGVFVTGFYYPVVPKGQARIRVQVSAGHTREQLEKCVASAAVVCIRPLARMQPPPRMVMFSLRWAMRAMPWLSWKTTFFSVVSLAR